MTGALPSLRYRRPKELMRIALSRASVSPRAPLYQKRCKCSQEAVHVILLMNKTRLQLSESHLIAMFQ